MGTEQRNSYFAGSIRPTKSGSPRMAPYHAWGWALAGRSFAYDSRARDSRCATALGLSVNLKGTATPGKPNGWSPHPIPKEDLGLTPLEARSVGVPCIASTDGGVQETAGPHALFCKPGDVDSLVLCMKKQFKWRTASIRSYPDWPKSTSNNMFAHWMSMQWSISA